MLFAQILYLRQPVGFRITADESEKQLKKRLRFTKRGRGAAHSLFVYNK